MNRKENVWLKQFSLTNQHLIKSGVIYIADLLRNNPTLCIAMLNSSGIKKNKIKWLLKILKCSRNVNFTGI